MKKVKVQQYEILRFQISGFILSDFIEKEFMPLTYIRHCFALAFLETLNDKTFEHEFCLWQNNSSNMLEVYFRREWSSEKHEQWLFSEEGLTELCSNVTSRINRIPYYSVCVSVSPQTEPLSFVSLGNKNTVNTLVLEKKAFKAFWDGGVKGDRSLFFYRQNWALSGYLSFYHYDKNFLTKFLRYLSKNEV